MKVYLIEMDNGESYEDQRNWIDSAFTTFRGASQHLLDRGFKVSYSPSYNGEHGICFTEDDSEYPCYYAEIITMNVQKYKVK